MPLHILSEKIFFPPVEDALQDGLLAMGGDVSEQRLLLAYRKGIFPLYNDEIPLWWSPDPRFVLFPDKLKVTKSMQQIIRKDVFQFTINQNFEEVIYCCKTIERNEEHVTWISEDILKAFTNLHYKGFAHSAETWYNGKLVGGLYGIRLGKIFFGESMFSLVSNASKFAFISYVQQLQKEDVALIDCQVYTKYLESFGAEMIARKEFIVLLNNFIK